VSLARDARHWLRAHRHGLLSTHSQAVEGFPFGSVIPYVLDKDACPVMLVSRLAEHTKNITADARVSLLVHEDRADVQAAARITLIGNAQRVNDPTTVELRYQRYFPATCGYREGLDFDYWRIVPVTLRVIAGFAKVHWLSREAYAPPAHTLHESEPDILAHMNADHADTLRLYCRFRHAFDPVHLEMIGIDCDGFDVRADGKFLRFDFDDVVTDAGQVRAALAALARQARGAPTA
jgi:hypothetical protein